MSEFRIGHGFDVHRLEAGRKLILCGVEIPHEKGLDGHSDADVAVHALMDALFGAAGMGDIGLHFPPSDVRYKDADSMILLQTVLEKLTANGLSRVVNIDITIMAEHPKLRPYIESMRSKLSEVLAIDSGCINVKATTTEKLGFVGREEGLAAEAVCLIEFAGKK